MKYLSLLLSGILLPCSLLAAIRTSEAARKVAMRYDAGQQLQLAYTCMAEETSAEEAEGVALYYVFNRQQDGFVVVAANEHARTVLGYADAGYFDAQNVPEGLSDLLDGYAKQLQLLESEDTEWDDELVEEEDEEESFPVSVAPLLGDMRFKQKDPFNRLCPNTTTTSSTKSAAGCVAIAMAQIMKYYEYPAKGTGSYSYTVSKSGIECSANFGNTTYDWSKIYNYYDGSESDASCNEAATLVYHCGVSVDMNYGTSSGASSEKVPGSMNQYFGYDCNANFRSHYYYTNAEWEALIKEELVAGRPVYMSGHNPSSGHAFVCDGYNADNYFHFNWGWAGSSNGYFTLDCLDGMTPLSQGTGGSDAGYGQKQGMVRGLEPSTGAAAKPELDITNETTVTSSKLTLKIENHWASTFNGAIGLMAYKNGVAQKTYSLSTTTIEANKSCSVTANVSSFSSLEGQVLCPVYKRQGESTWYPVHTEVSGFHAVKISSSKFVDDSSERARLTLIELKAENPFYLGYNARFSVTVKNSSSFEFNSLVYLKLKDSNATAVTSDQINLIVGAGEERTFQITVPITDVATGDCQVYACYDGRLGTKYKMSGTYTDATNKVNRYTINAAPTQSPSLKVSKLELVDHADKVIYRDEPVTLRATIVNSGGYFEALTRVVVFCPPATTSVLSQGKHRVYYQSGTIVEEFPLQMNLDPGSYHLRIYYYDADDNSTMMSSKTTNANKLSFTIKESPTAISAIEEHIPAADDYLLEGTQFRVRNRKLILIKQ